MEQGLKCKTLNYKTWEKNLHNLQLGRILTLDTTSMIHVWKNNNHQKFCSKIGLMKKYYERCHLE